MDFGQKPMSSSIPSRISAGRRSPQPRSAGGLAAMALLSAGVTGPKKTRATARRP